MKSREWCPLLRDPKMRAAGRLAARIVSTTGIPKDPAGRRSFEPLLTVRFKG